ncbi:MAG: sulfatase family protein, partial [Pirellulales bacterium]
EYGNHAGKTPYREGKWTAYEGGTRNATIIKYPKAIKAGTTCDKFISSLDVVPTLLELAGVENKFHSMDGKDIIDYFNPNVEHKNLHVYYPFTVPKFLGGFSGVCSADGRWKLVVPFTVRSAATIGNDGVPGEEQRHISKLALYDMKNDPYEKNNVIDKHPELVAQLMKFARSHNQKFYPAKFSIDKRIMKK